MIQRTHSSIAFHLTLFLLIATLAARADVKLPALFTDHMVLQQGQPLKVWGWAEAGEAITVEFRKQSVAAKSRHQARIRYRYA